MEIAKISLHNYSFEDNISELKSIMKNSVGDFPSDLYTDRPVPDIAVRTDFGLLAYDRLGKRENDFGRVPFASFKLGMKLKERRKKRANELKEDDYEYFAGNNQEDNKIIN